MDGELLPWLYHRLLHDPALATTHDCTYSDGLILFMHCYATLFNRSGLWVSDPRHWPLAYRRLRLPSYSQYCKRLRTPRVTQLLQQLDEELRTRLPHSNLKFFDGKPLVVSGFSKDKHATLGYVPGGYARGYKVHLQIDSLGRIERFVVTGMHAGEPVLARVLIRRQDLSGLLIRTDSNYDSNHLYRGVTRRHGCLRAPRKKPFTGIGHCPQEPMRLAAIEELEASKQTLREHRRIRATVEQHIGRLANFPGGLWALPGFVRTPRRVTRCVSTKIMLYHLMKVLELRHRRAA